MGLNVPAGGGAGAHRMLDQDPPHEASAAMSAAQTYFLAYLASMYPMLSMTFILREVLQLRQMGFRIDVASINAPDRTMKGLTAEEAAEAARTYHLKSHGLPGAVTAHLRVLLENFVGNRVALDSRVVWAGWT